MHKIQFRKTQFISFEKLYRIYTVWWTVPFPDIISRMLGCRRTVLRLGEDIAMDLADLSRCNMLA